METFTYSVTDAAGNTTQSTLKITLTPVNDAATFTGDINKTITETNAAQSVGGTLTVTDVDSLNTVTAQTAVAGSAGYGKFTISTAGVWSYVMDSAQNQFVAGQTYDDTLTVTTADGTQKVIKVTITGTNDTPTVVSFYGKWYGSAGPWRHDHIGRCRASQLARRHGSGGGHEHRQPGHGRHLDLRHPSRIRHHQQL